MREQLKTTSIEVLEIVPPYVQSALLAPSGLTDEHAMPMANFVAEAMRIIRNGKNDEVLVEGVKPLRYAEANGRYGATFAQLNKLRF